VSPVGAIVMMDARDVLEVLACLRSADVGVWIDGGWGIDALLREQTREHDDLDVTILLASSARAAAALGSLEFVVVEDELPTRFVVHDDRDRRIDFHTITFDEMGRGWQQLQDGSRALYPPPGFLGAGMIGGLPVACLTAEVQLLHHLGYDPDDVDRRDLRLLAERFGLSLPAPYAI
jgi:lincosamide nucleotidyltransferase A/C/D/E